MTDTLSICHDPATDYFTVDLRLADRLFTTKHPIVLTDTTVLRTDSTVITQNAPKGFLQSVLDGMQKAGEVIVAVAIGYLLGRVIP